MKDKIINILKDNKANVTLFVGVLVISVVLFKLSFVYKAETAKLQEEKVRLGNDTKQINDTKYKLGPANNDSAIENAASLKDGFNKYYTSLMDEYNHDKSDVAKMRSEDVQDKFLESLELLRSECSSSGVSINEGFKFSFNNEVSRIFQMAPRDKVKVMEQLTAVENMVKIFASSGVVSIGSIVRPRNLEETKVSQKYAKVYTFKLVLKLKPESFAGFLNRITNDRHFYYRVNSVSMVTDAQVDKDLRPLLLGQVKKSMKINKASQVTQGIDGLLDGVGEDLVEELPVEKVNIRAFNTPSQTVTISLDWIQFKESYLEK